MHKKFNIKNPSSNTKGKIIFGIVSSSVLTFGGAHLAKEFIKKYKDNNIEYSIDNNGERKINNDISFELLEKYYIIKYENEYYIAEKIISYQNKNIYYNIFDGEKITESNECLDVKLMSEYLIENNIIKNYYTEEDLVNILNNITDIQYKQKK